MFYAADDLSHISGGQFTKKLISFLTRTNQEQKNEKEEEVEATLGYLHGARHFLVSRSLNKLKSAADNASLEFGSRSIGSVCSKSDFVETFENFVKKAKGFPFLNPEWFDKTLKTIVSSMQSKLQNFGETKLPFLVQESKWLDNTLRILEGCIKPKLKTFVEDFRKLSENAKLVLEEMKKK